MKEHHPSTPLNRLADAVPPESETARRFNELAQLIVNGKASPQQWQEARERLALWRDNDAKLEPLLGGSELTEELIPLSQSLSQVAAAGLQALDDLENHRTADAALYAKNLQTVKDAEKPQAELLDKAAPGVELLLQAAVPRP
jgi:hexosaminidase